MNENCTAACRVAPLAFDATKKQLAAAEAVELQLSPVDTTVKCDALLATDRQAIQCEVVPAATNELPLVVSVTTADNDCGVELEPKETQVAVAFPVPAAETMFLTSTTP